MQLDTQSKVLNQTIHDAQMQTFQLVNVMTPT
jgi:hypothetical protein